MFVLAEMRDLVRVPPWKFNLKINDAVSEEINRKLANKVVVDVGLCLSLFDITKIEDSYIYPGDGASHTKVEFRYIVFRPFLEEILIGKIKNCSREGVYVSLGFFDDIIIPPDELQHPARFDETEQTWVWEYKMEDQKHDLFMDPGEEIRFRVVLEQFVDTTPTGPETQETVENETRETKIPYMLTGSISESGLGLLSWWSN